MEQKIKQDNCNIGKNIREIRKEKKMSQEELCKKANVSRAIISDLETGKRTVTSTKTLSKIASALGCSVADIFLT